MKPSSVVYTTALLWGFSTAALMNPQAASAVSFSHKELDQSRVIAIAVPLAQGDRYNLLILEQLANSRPCWQPNANNPNTIDPLLLKFDFTNICGRSTDSNGYSIRIAGEDKALDYRLSIARDNNRLVLLGISSRDRQRSPLEIARTETLDSGFLKLTLNPGWRFTKRTYNGKTLGHIYLTRDVEPTSAYVATAQSSSSRSSSSRSSNASGSLFKGRPSTYPTQARRTSTLTAPLITAPIEISVPTVLGPRTPRSPITTNGGVFTPPPNAGLPMIAAGVLPVPTANIPLGTAENAPDLITAATPGINMDQMAPGAIGVPTRGGFQIAMVNPRYRVFANTTNPNQQKTVKTLVPDSFRSSYRGRTLLQVGAFQDRTKADEVIDLLNRNGIDSILATE